MAAPAVQLRLPPTGLHLFDGYSSVVAFALDTNIEIWEKSVTPFGLDGREPVDQTTMWNLIYVTRAPRKLRDITALSIVCAYDPKAWTSCNIMLNRVQAITHSWSDGSTLTVWGFLQKVEMAELVEGEQPEMTLTVMVANIDPNTLTQIGLAGTGPVLTEVTGTGGYNLSTTMIPTAA